MIHPLRAAAFLSLAAALSGCALLGAAAGSNGQKIPAAYTGLANQSVAIVIYADQAETDEFPNARQEIGNFLTASFHAKLPSVKLLDPREVIAWQDDTLNWPSLSEKEIAKHFGVQKVLYIELLDYSTRANKSFGDLQGHIRAQCSIFDADAAGTSAAWTDLVEVRWPKDHPLDPTAGSEVGVRKRALEEFSDQLTNNFIEHREYTESIRDEEE